MMKSKERRLPFLRLERQVVSLVRISKLGKGANLGRTGV